MLGKLNGQLGFVPHPAEKAEPLGREGNLAEFVRIHEFLQLHARPLCRGLNRFADLLPGPVPPWGSGDIRGWSLGRMLMTARLLDDEETWPDELLAVLRGGPGVLAAYEERRAAIDEATESDVILRIHRPPTTTSMPGRRSWPSATPGRARPTWWAVTARG